MTFDTIILLTGPTEQPVLAELLRRHHPALAIHGAVTRAELDAIEANVLARARLLAFATATIVPPRILNAVGFGSYNFHPGPPHYPGFAPSHVAIYDGATDFGATAHIMVERVDAGPIVGVESFRIPPHTGVLRLEQLAYARLARLFWALSGQLARQAEPLPVLPLQWSGKKSTRRSLEAIYRLPVSAAAA